MPEGVFVTHFGPRRFIGVWDTVSSVGYVDDLITGKYVRLPYTAANPGVEAVRHVVAIDERRDFFRQNLMHQCPKNISIKNVWFAGVHSDVGAGTLHPRPTSRV